MNHRLDIKNIELLRILFDMKQSLGVYKLIALNAKAINEKGAGKTFWGMTQKAALRLFIIDLCKIFENKKRYELNSIPGILALIKNNRILLKNFEPIRIFLNRRDIIIFGEAEYLEILLGVINEFIDENKVHLDSCRTWRNKKFVHAEDVVSSGLENLPSFEILEKLLEFGIEFYSMVSEAYIEVFPFHLENEKRVETALYSIFNQIGIKNIKSNFS